MKRILSLVYGIFLLASCLPGVQTMRGQALQPADFAYGIPIDTLGQQPVQAFELPQTVYEHLTRDDLGDLRIFNSTGTAVPHALHHAAETPEAVAQTLSVPFFPMYGQERQSLSELGVQVQRTRGGTLIRVDERQRTPQRNLRAYLVDASQVEERVDKLTFHWPAPPENLMAQMTVETSNDLINWRSWGSAGTLTSMRHNESVLVKNKLDLPAREAKYYRVSWRTASTFPDIDRLEVTTAPDRPELERHWSSIPLTEEEDGVYTATIPGTIPADRVEIELPDAQTVVRVRVESAAEPDGPWVHHHSGLAYNLQAGEDAWRSPPISVYRNTHRYWRLTVDEDASGVLLGTPSLRLGWIPARLLFIPQGEAPYTLAFGNADADLAGFNSAELFRPLANDYNDVFDLPVTTLGAVVELGGKERLTPTTEIPWQQVILWGAMLAGVALMAMLAMRLLQQAKSE